MANARARRQAAKHRHARPSPRRDAARPRDSQPAQVEPIANPRPAGRDAAEAVAVAALAAVLFATTFSPHVALGDAPESVAGVKTVGILHAPGYPSYVVAGRLFGTIVAVGSWSLRVNLFSLVCASATVGVVYAIARAFAASRAGSAIGALALAASASFWFNAGFAKHYPWTALLLALSVLFVTRWQDGGSEWWLIAAALAIAADVGSGWQLAAMVTVALVVMVVLGPRSPSSRALILSAGALVLGVVALAVFVMVRASQDPLLNWGDATNPGRLAGLVGRSDFAGVGTENAAGIGVRTAGVFGGIVRDFGAGAVAFAVVGIASWRRMRRDHAAFLAVAGVLNIGAVIVGTELSGIYGFTTVITQGGYLLLTMITISLLAARGVTAAVEWASGRTSAQWLAVAAAVMIAAVVIGPSVAVHKAHADFDVPPLSDNYAKRVLDALPAHAVLLVWNEEYEMPMIKRQLVDGERRDVTIVAPNSLRLEWARDQIARRLHLGNVLDQATLQLQIIALAGSVLEHRPVYLDALTMFKLQNLVGYEAEGVVGKVVKGDTGPHRTSDAATQSARLEQWDRADGLSHAYDRLPFSSVYYLRERAHIELAKAFALEHDPTGAVRELQRAVALLPDDNGTRDALHRAQKADASSVFAAIASA